MAQKEKKEKKKKNTKYSGHYVPLQRPRAARTLRSDQLLTNIYNFTISLYFAFYTF